MTWRKVAVKSIWGQIISNDGSNVKNVAFRAGKGTGMVNMIENIIKNIPGGKYHFELAVILRNAYLISSMLLCYPAVKCGTVLPRET